MYILDDTFMNILDMCQGLSVEELNCLIDSIECIIDNKEEEEEEENE